MKILLLGFNVQQDIFPLGLAYIKGYAESKLDVDIEVKEFPFGNNFNYDTNNTIEQQVMSYILLKKPDILGFTGYIWSIKILKNIAKAIKAINPNIKIIIGGSEVNKDALGAIDYVIYGEGEIAFTKLLKFLNNEIKIEDVPNIIYKDKNEIKTNRREEIDDLDKIPFPYRQQFKTKYPVIKIETTRGCIFNCKYCNYAKTKNRNFSIGYLQKNIKYLFENYDFSILTIIDANLNADKKRMISILDIIEEQVQNKEKRLRVNMELKPELIDEELVLKLKEYTFSIKTELGLQSTDTEVMKACNRPFDLLKVKNALALLDRTKIKYKIDLMYGLPKDNFFKFLNSIDFVLKNSKKQNKIVAHHNMVLNNTDFYSEGLKRFHENRSSMAIQTHTQNILDFYKTKLFIDLLNKTLEENKSSKK